MREHMMMMMKCEALSDTNAKFTLCSAKVQMNENAELTKSAHSDDAVAKSITSHSLSTVL